MFSSKKVSLAAPKILNFVLVRGNVIYFRFGFYVGTKRTNKVTRSRRLSSLIYCIRENEIMDAHGTHSEKMGGGK